MKLFTGNSEESRLIKGCAKGKPQFQEALYNKYYRKMFGVCLRYAGDKQDAEDVLQEGFIKVFKSIRKYRSEGSLEGWIRRIMVNTALELHRKRSKMYPVAELEAGYAADSGHDLVASMGEAEILEMIQALPDGYRTIFNMYAIEGYSHREIANMLDISEGTSKSQLARARRALQETIHQSRQEAYGTAK